MRVVLDTNVVVSSFLSPTGAPSRIFDHWQQETFDVVVSEPILQEYEHVLLYEHIQTRHHMTPLQIRKVIDEFRRFALLVTPTKTVHIVSQDPEDNKFIECAIAGSALFIVSGDTDLLIVREYQGIHIFNPGDFLTLLEKTQENPGSQ